MLRQNSDNKYCDYAPVNALLEQFEATAEQHGIQFIVDIAMMFSLIDERELLKIISIALEIGVDLCDALPEGREKYIRVRGNFNPRWCIAIDAPCREDLRVDVDSDENEFPLDKDGGRDPRTVKLFETLRALDFGVYLYRSEGRYQFFMVDPGDDWTPADTGKEPDHGNPQ